MSCGRTTATCGWTLGRACRRSARLVWRASRSQLWCSGRACRHSALLVWRVSHSQLWCSCCLTNSGSLSWCRDRFPGSKGHASRGFGLSGFVGFVQRYPSELSYTAITLGRSSRGISALNSRSAAAPPPHPWRHYWGIVIWVADHRRGFCTGQHGPCLYPGGNISVSCAAMTSVQCSAVRGTDRVRKQRRLLLFLLQILFLHKKGCWTCAPPVTTALRCTSR